MLVPLHQTIVMDRTFSPSGRLAELTQSWNGTAFLIGAVIFPLIGFMDFFVSPENFVRFTRYRIGMSGVLLLLYYLNRLRRSIAYQYVIVAAATAFSAAVIELAILQSGGQSSTYYAAMMIVTICALGLVPISLGFAFVLVAIIYGIYVVPLLFSGPVTSGVFVSNNAFLVTMFVVALILRYHNQNLILSELALREELSREKAKLEVHSATLADRIAEKTGELAISEQKFRALFENAMDGIAVLDRQGAIVTVNSRFSEIHGFPRGDLAGTDFRMLVSRQHAAVFEARFREILNGATVVFEAENYRMGGGTVSLEISAKEVLIGHVPHVQLFLRDITEKKRLQEHVMQSQKLESMGVLAGGIAHDFRNVLTAILGQSEVLKRRVSDDEIARQRIATIENSAGRAGQMITKLLSFSRNERFELVPTDLNAVVRETVDLIDRSLAHRKVTINVSTDDTLSSIYGDRVHIEQAITNLVLNAADAMPGGGTIILSTGSADLRDRPPTASPFIEPGMYVVLTVSDAGTGIVADIRHRIFEPFFTTKPVGKGTGLGLAMVYGIIKSHGGEIDVMSREGEGTTFSLYFPAGAPRNAALPPAVIAGQADVRTVLVVDNEQRILGLLKDILGAHGFTVMLSDNPFAARDLVRNMPGGIDVVLADMAMPLLKGVDLARLMKEIDPAVRIIGMSRQAADDPAEDLRSLDGFLLKPIDATALLASLRNCTEHID